MNNQGPFYFSQSKVKGFGEFVHWTIENLFLFRFTFFKNRPRNSYLLIRAFMVTGIIFGLYYSVFSSLDFLIFGVEVEPALLFVAFSTIGYWNMYYSFQQKCAYVNGLYNEVIKEYATGNRTSANLMSVNFASQLMSMDLWSHRMYSEIFNQVLEDSVNYAFSKDNSNRITNESQDQFEERLTNGQVRVGEMRMIFFSYKRYLYQACLNEGEESKRHLKAI